MSTPGYDVIEWRQTWRIVDGRHYREAIARRLSDGCLRLISVLDEQ